MLNLFKQQKAPEAQLLFRGEKVSIKDAFLMGRSVQCDMQLSDTQISRTHAEIIPDKLGNWWLHDLGSTNGSYINFVRTSQPTIIKSGDRINMGKYEMFFHHPPDTMETELINPQPLDEELSIETRLYYFALITIRAASRNGDDYEHDDIVSLGSAWFKEINNMVNAYDGELGLTLPNQFLAIFPVNLSADTLLAWIHELQQEPLTKEFDYRICLHHGEMKIGKTDKNGNERLIGEDVANIFRYSEKAQCLGHRLVLSESCAKAFIGKNMNILGDFHIPGLSGKHSLFTLNEESQRDS